MAMRRTGDWVKVGALIGNLSKEMSRASKLSLKRFGLKLEGTAKKHISNQDLNWVPLKAKTVARKIRKGYSENILVETSDYFQAITSYVKKDTVYVGVKKDVTSRDGDIVHSIAAVHEFGSGAIPARPLWQPSFDETVKWHIANNSPVDIFAKRIKKYYK